MLDEHSSSTIQHCPIILACNGGYAMPLATTLRSLAESNEAHWPLFVYILITEFPLEARKRVELSVPLGAMVIRWIPVKLGAFSGFTTLKHISLNTFSRLLIPEVIDSNCNRVLYIDTDTLVLSDLQELWSTDLNDKPVGAVIDRFDAQIKSGQLAENDMPHVRNYFNAGVLLINLPRWRAEGISEKALEYLRLHPQSPYADQDALNVACDERWMGLDIRWNFQNHYATDIAMLPSSSRPAIVHFITHRKPWDPSVLNVNAALYNAYRARTCYRQNIVQTAHGHVLRYVYIIKKRLRRFTRLRTMWRYGKAIISGTR